LPCPQRGEKRTRGPIMGCGIRTAGGHRCATVAERPRETEVRVHCGTGSIGRCRIHHRLEEGACDVAGTDGPVRARLTVRYRSFARIVATLRVMVELRKVIPGTAANS